MRQSLSIGLLLLALAPAEALAGGPKPRRGARMNVDATAYCLRGNTSDGHMARTGMVAADPRVLPIGTVFRIVGPPGSPRGTYRVSDIGKQVKGREIDIYMPSCRDARKFGRRRVQLRVVETGE